MQGEDGESRHLPIRHKTCPDKTKHWLTHYTMGIKVVAVAEGTYQQDLRTVLQQKIEARLSHETAASSDQPVDIRTFITHPDYCGDTGFWEKPLQELEAILDERCYGAVIEKGIRGSKSYTACYIPVYLTYRQLHAEYVQGKDPRIQYGLDPEATVIYNAIFTITGVLARRLFSYVSQFVERCAWFKRPDVADKIQRNRDIRSEVQFCPVGKDGKIDKTAPRYVIYPGTSKLTSAAGVALFSYILDECNLFTVADTSGADHAADLDEELDKRVSSSFGKYGKRIYISRREIENDFTQRKIAAWQKDPDHLTKFHIPPPKTSWEDWPESRNQEEQWRLFNPDKFDWVKDEEGNDLPACGYDEIDEQFWVPDRFWSDFTTDPEGSLKVLGSIPAGASSPFFRRTDKVVPDYELENPVLPETRPTDWMVEGFLDTQELYAHFDSLVADWFWGERGEWYHFHVDLGLSRDGKGDAAGLAVVRNAGVDSAAYTSEDRRPERCVLVDVELLLQIKAPPGGEVLFSRVREIIYWLHRHRGFRFLKSSYDGWQSVDSVQTLYGEGYDVETLSVDRKIDHYNTLKQGIYEARIAIPPAHGQTKDTRRQQLYKMADDGDPCAVVQRELLQLELINGKKVDHPAHGTKDVADAMCGAVSHAVSYIRPSARALL